MPGRRPSRGQGPLWLACWTLEEWDRGEGLVSVAACKRPLTLKQPESGCFRSPVRPQAPGASLTSLAGLGMAGWEGPLVGSRWLWPASIPCRDGPLKAENDPLALTEYRMHRHSAVQSPTGRGMRRINVEVLIGPFLQGTASV